MKNNLLTKNITWIWRSAIVLGGLSLAACAPLAVPGEGGQPASNGVSQQMTSTDDGLSQTPEASHTPEASQTTEATQIGTVTALPSATPGASSTPLPGQTSTAVAGQEVEFIGTIESFNNGVLVVSGRTVIITAQTEVKLQPQKGLNVKVHGTLQADGSVLAREIESVPAGQATHKPDLTLTPRAEGTRQPQGTRQAGETEFTGTVSSINGNVFIVNGITVTVTGEIKGTIAVGDTVKVHGVTQADGSVVAREIERADGDDDGDDDGRGGHGSDDDNSTPAPTSTGGSDDHGGNGGGSGSDDHGDDDDNSGRGGDDDDDNDDNGGGHGGDDDGGDDRGGDD
jgi:hypothetical protein